MTTQQTAPSAPLPRYAFYAATATALACVAQALFGILHVVKVEGNWMVFHEVVAYVTLAAAVATGVLAMMAKYFTVPAGILLGLTVAQFALGEMHLQHIHMGLGVAVLLAAVYVSSIMARPSRVAE